MLINGRAAKVEKPRKQIAIPKASRSRYARKMIVVEWRRRPGMSRSAAPCCSATTHMPTCPHLHRRLAIEAAEANVSLNRLVSAKHAQA